jgi:hypothetical protein
MQLQTYKQKVLAGTRESGVRQSQLVPCVKWQVDDSASVMISEGPVFILAPLRPITKGPARAAATSYCNPGRSKQFQHENQIYPLITRNELTVVEA